MALNAVIDDLAPGSAPTAQEINQLTLACDEVFQRRFNRRSFLAFASGVGPDLELGEQFLFGTASNLRTSASPYDDALEDPDPPVGGQVVSYDASTKVLWVTSMDSTRTLNRKRVLWTPPGGSESSWWLGFTKPERWEPLALAELIVEDYEETIGVEEPTNAVFTLRSAWDRFGCYRIHNGNRHALLVQVEGGEQTWTLPPYGVITLRRPSPTSDLFESPSTTRYYTCPTYVGEPLRWEAPAPGQFAASLELAADLVDQMLELEASTWAHGDWDGGESASWQHWKDGTSAPSSTDTVFDWVFHRGDLLSIVLDRRDGSRTVTRLTWSGIGSVPDASWSGHVDVEIDGATVTLTSAATAPTGASDEEWEHDLVPITTNLISGPVALKDTPHVIDVGSIGAAPSLGPRLQPVEVVETEVSQYRPTIAANGYTSTGGSAWSYLLWEHSDLVPSWTDAMATLADLLMAPSVPTDWTSSGDQIKTHAGILRRAILSVPAAADYGVAQFGSGLLSAATPPSGWGWTATDDGSLGWLAAIGRSTADTRRRWVPRVPRRWVSAGSLVSGVATFDVHPQDRYPLGTPDGLGGALGWAPGSILSAGVRVEGDAPGSLATAHGREVYPPVDVLDWVAGNIDSATWWGTNRDAVIAGSLPESEKLRTIRHPRVVEEFNDLAAAFGAVSWIRRVNVTQLHRDPMPDSPELPWSFGGESPFAVPDDWAYGRVDTDETLADWAAIWGITVEATLPGLADLRTPDRLRWAQQWWQWAMPSGQAYPSGASISARSIARTSDMVAEPYSTFSPGEVFDTVNGYAFSSHKAWSATVQRQLFGAAGAETEYAWVKYSALVQVFHPLGVEVPQAEVGEKYVPRFLIPTIALIEGAYTQPSEGLEGHLGWVGTAPVEQVDDVEDVLTPVRDCINLDGLTWRRQIAEAVPFRLSQLAEAVNERFGRQENLGTIEYDTFWSSTYGKWQGDPPEFVDTGVDIMREATGVGTQWLIWEANIGADGRLLNRFSRRALAARSSAGGAPSCPDIATFRAPFPVRLSGTPEPVYEGYWTGNPALQPATARMEPEEYQLRTLVVPPDEAVNWDYLQTKGWPVAPAYRIQWTRVGNEYVTGFMND